MEVFITKKDWDKIINYARCSSDKWGTEIGGMAVVLQDKDDDWKIQDPMIIKQEVSASLCELDKTELAQYYSRMDTKYKKKNMRFCWWHSHAKMSAFWSGTDTNTIDEYEDGDLSFALVVNVKEEYKCRVSVWKPFTMHEDVELNILDQEEDQYKIPKTIATEVQALCSQPKRDWYNSGSSYNPRNINSIVNSSQTALFGESINSERNIIRIAWSQLLEKLDEINAGFVAGEYQYDKYSKKIVALNGRLKKAKMPLTVTLIEQCNFEELLHCHPWDLIECEAGYEALDPSEAYLDDMDDYTQWNRSFGAEEI